MPTNFVIGQIMMLIASREVRAQPGRLLTVPLEFLLAYSAFIFVPVASYFFYAHPAWSTVYLRPEDTIAWWWGPIIVLQYFLGMLFGALLAQTLIQLGHKKMAYLTFLLSVIWLVGIWGFTSTHYMTVGTFAEFHSHTARPLLESNDFRLKLNLFGVVLAVPLLVMAAYFFHRSKRDSVNEPR